MFETTTLKRKFILPTFGKINIEVGPLSYYFPNYKQGYALNFHDYREEREYLPLLKNIQSSYQFIADVCCILEGSKWQGNVNSSCFSFQTFNDIRKKLLYKTPLVPERTVYSVT